MAKDIKTIIDGFKNKKNTKEKKSGETLKAKMGAGLLVGSLLLGAIGVSAIDGAHKKNNNVQDKAEATASAVVTDVKSLNQDPASVQLDRVTNRLTEELQNAGVTQDQINILTARIEKSTTEQEMEEAMKTMQKSLEKMIADSVDAKIKEVAESKEEVQNGQAQENSSLESYKQLAIQIDSLSETLFKIEQDIKSGVRSDYNKMFLEAQEIVKIIDENFERITYLSTNPTSTSEIKYAYRADQDLIQRVHKSAKNVYRYAVALEIDNGIDKTTQEFGCAEFMVKSGDHDVYVTINENDKKAVRVSGDHLGVYDGGKETITDGNNVEESTVLKYQKEIYSIEANIKEMIDDSIFDDDRYSFSYDSVKGYVISSNGITIENAPEELAIKLDEDGSLEELKLTDYGHTATVEIGEVSEEAFEKSFNQAHDEIKKLAERQGEGAEM